MTEKNVELPELPQTGYAWWKTLSSAQREYYMNPRFEAGHSNGKIREEFKLTGRVGVVAGMRNKYNRKLHPERYTKDSNGQFRSLASKPTGRKRIVENRPKTRTTPFQGEGATRVPEDAFNNLSGSETIPSLRYSAPTTNLSSREKRLRGYYESETEFGGRLSPFPIPSEVSGNPKDLSRAIIHAIASLYRS